MDLIKNIIKYIVYKFELYKFKYHFIFSEMLLIVFKLYSI